jgi:hypothetical protein
MRHTTIALTLFLGACSSTPNIVDLGGGRFTVSKSAMTGTSGVGTIRAAALQEATEQCRKVRRVVQVETENEREPWYVPGNYRKLEITFRCVIGPTD